MNDEYYKRNYQVFSGEVIADINALYDFKLFVETFGIELFKVDRKNICYKASDYVHQYGNHVRDFTGCIAFNSYYLNFEEAFDTAIIFNPNWLLEFPQLNIEYYLDDNGDVIKRTSKELEERLENEMDEDTREYIKSLLTSVNKDLVLERK